MAADRSSSGARYVERLGSDRWHQAYRALSGLGSRALDDVARGLEHPDWRVRRWCASLLDHHADEGCVPRLLALLRDPVPAVRRHAVHAIGCQSCKARPLPVDVVAILVRHAVSDPSPRVRRVAIHLLGCQPHDPRAVRALQRLLGRALPEKSRRAARWSLAEQRRRAPRERAKRAALGGSRVCRLAGT